MRIRYSYTLNDFEDISVEAEKLWPRARLWRNTRITCALLIVAIPILNGLGPLFPVPYFVAFGPLALILLYWGLQTPRRTARRYYKPSDTEYQAIIDDVGITTISPTVRTELKWAAFSSRIEARDVIALVYEQSMYLFPKRSFTVEQWSDFTHKVKAHVIERSGQHAN